MNAIYERVSIRNFKDTPVEKEKVEKLLRAAMQAPSAGDQRPWEFIVVTDKASQDLLGKASRFAGPAAKAPMVIVVLERTEGLRHADYTQQDLGACIENLLLEVVNQGLGAVWMGIAPLEDRMNYIADVLGVPGNVRPFAQIAVGYPDEEKKQTDRFDESRIHWEKY